MIPPGPLGIGFLSETCLVISRMGSMYLMQCPGVGCMWSMIILIFPPEVHGFLKVGHYSSILFIALQIWTITRSCWKKLSARQLLFRASCNVSSVLFASFESLTYWWTLEILIMAGKPREDWNESPEKTGISVLKIWYVPAGPCLNEIWNRLTSPSPSA